MIFKYIKYRFKSLLLFIIFDFIFFVLFYLYSLPLETLFYFSSICAFILISVGLYDFYDFYKKKKSLENCQKNIIEIIENLPKTNDILQSEYSELIKIIVNENKAVTSDYDNSRSEMIDYYTLWAHQIKTPISALSLLIQSDSKQDKTLLQSELFKIECYVDVVLQYLRLDTMTSDLLLKYCDLDKIVKTAVKKYALLFVYKKLNIDVQNINVKVLTDEKWLTFIIEQILSNAIKYTNTGSVKIYTVNKTILIIEDTGIGISSEDLPRIFDRGFTGYNGRMDKKASGLGLYLCKKISDKLQHKITVVSSLDKNTKVILDLTSSNIVIE